MGPIAANTTEAGDGRPAAELAPGHRVEQGGRGQHAGQAQDPGRGQSPDAVGGRAQGRVDDRGAGEVRSEVRHGPAVQPVRPFQMAGPQVQRLILVGRIRPHQLRDRPAWTTRMPASGQGPVARRGRAKRPFARSAGPRAGAAHISGAAACATGALG